MKPKKCNYSGCNEKRMKKPGNTLLYFKFCQQHQIASVLSKVKAETEKDKAGLEIMRKTGSNNATSEKTRALKLADNWFSKFIRLKHSFELDGIQQAKCYTCENVYPIVKMDCGHWQKRQYMATRFHIDNCRPQCSSCNDWNKGRYEIFEERLINEVGRENVLFLKELANSTCHFSVEDLKDTANGCKKEFKELLKQRGQTNPWK